MTRKARIIVSSLLLLSLSTRLWGDTPDGNYALESSRSSSDGKRLVVVRLNRPIEDDALAVIANRIHTVEDATKSRVYISFLLPEMINGEGAWATATYEPTLKVLVLGIPLSQLSKPLPLKPSQEIVKEWLDGRPYCGRKVLYREDGKLYLFSEVSGGTGLANPITATKQGSDIRIQIHNGHNEHGIVRADNTLELFKNGELFARCTPWTNTQQNQSQN